MLRHLCFSCCEETFFGKRKEDKGQALAHALQPDPAKDLPKANETASFRAQDLQKTQPPNKEAPGSSTVYQENCEQSERSGVSSQKSQNSPEAPHSKPGGTAPTENPTHPSKQISTRSQGPLTKPKIITFNSTISPKIVTESPVSLTSNSNNMVFHGPQRQDDQPHPTPRSSTLSSPQFSKAVRLVVQTKFENQGLHESEERVLDLLRGQGVKIQDNYMLIEETKRFADKFISNSEQEISLYEGTCTISCNCKSECGILDKHRPLENLEQWGEVEALTASFEGQGHNKLSIRIFRRLTLNKKKQPNITPKNAISWIRKELMNSMKLTQTGGTKLYLPKDKLLNFTFRKVYEALVQDENAIFSIPMNDHANRTDLAHRIYRQASLLMLLCLYELHGEAPFQLVESFLIHYNSKEVPLPLPLECPAWLNKDLVSSYQKCYANQWTFQAAVFNTVGQNQIFPDDVIIPYTLKKRIASGSFSNVYEVQFDPSHQNLYKIKQNSNPRLALKSVQRHSKGINMAKTNEAFKNERMILKGLGNINHNHIIKLLATYYQGDHCHFLFPLACQDLDQHMQTNPVGFKSPATKEHRDFLPWIWGQMEGIANGIHAFHENTHEKRLQNVSKDFLDPNVANEVKPAETGYHHDIKPSNILYFKEGEVSVEGSVPSQGLLQIADFGIGKFHSERSGNTSKGEERARGTITYSAPESKVPRTLMPEEQDKSQGASLKLSRPYDVWSFGCVLLEVLVWVVYGSVGLEEFRDQRFGPAEAGDLTNENDAFYFLGNEKEPRVRDSVKSWMFELSKHRRILQPPHGSLEKILKLVQEVLAVDPKQRPNALEVSQRLHEITKIAEDEANGLDTITEVPSNASTVPIIVATAAENNGHGSSSQRSMQGIAIQSNHQPEFPEWSKNQPPRTDTIATVKSDDSKSSTAVQPKISLSSDRDSV